MSSSYNSNTSVPIEDLTESVEIEDTHLMIIEDDEDTKKASIRTLKKNLIGDYSDPDEMKFYSSQKTSELLTAIKAELGDKADADTIATIEKRIADIVAVPSDGSKDQELVDARNGEISLSTRLTKDIESADKKYVHTSTTNPDATFDDVISEIDNINSKMNDKIEPCNLITNQGIIQFFTNPSLTSSGCTLVDSTEDVGLRNGVYSKKLTIDEDASTNPAFKQVLNKTTDVIETVSLVFYVDRTTFNEFTDTDGIRVHLSSDKETIKITNYLTYIIKKSEMVQGWNCVKRKLTDFTEVGSPNANKIKTVTIEIGRNDSLNGSQFYFNSIIFNQKMKPTLLLSFDGFYDESLTYLYPYLTSRNIPFTLFLNNRTTLSNETLDALIKLRISPLCDIGVYGCNPNKEQLIEDDNYRNQYTALRTSREWLQSNILDKPISYSAPYGNLRPITVPILKDLGYKIARTSANSYCSQFTKKDFAMPMFLISNLTTLDEVKAKIDYAIDTNQTISLYTNDVTEYGDEASSTKLMFESIVDYILEKVESGKLQCMTFDEFYRKCVE